MTYDELSFHDFVLGYTIIAEQQRPSTRKAMINHLQALCRDIGKHGWDATRDFHGIVLNEIELGQLTWHDCKAIQQLRVDELWTFKPRESTRNIVGKYCFAFNNGKCQHDGDHPGDKGGVYRHICGYCAKLGEAHCHTELQCTRKSNENTDVYTKHE